MRPRAVEPSAGLATPETYLGAKRAEGWWPDGGLAPGRRTFPAPPSDLPLNVFALSGTWNVGPQATTAGAGARIAVRFSARRVYLVLSSAGDRPRAIRVSVDGVPTRVVTVRNQRLYELVNLPRAGRHRLELSVAPGISGYAFTFG